MWGNENYPIFDLSKTNKMEEIVELLRAHGFKKTTAPNILGKQGYYVVISKAGTVTITHYTPIVKRFLWSESYYNMDNLKKYLNESHQS